MRVFALALVLMLVGVCFILSAPKPDAAVDRASAEPDILESVFRYQFEHNSSGHKPLDFDYFFLSLAEAKDPPKDPPAGLLARFKGHVPPVEPVSLADADARPHSGVRHKLKGGRCMLLFLGRIRWLDDDTVEVEGGYQAGCRSENTYRTERRNGAWVVVSDTLHWIS
jgi:hypothetical protein